MPIYICNHCGESIKNNGGSAREVGMFHAGNKIYHESCAAEIIVQLMKLEGWLYG